jgi:hypothetical protein
MQPLKVYVASGQLVLIFGGHLRRADQKLLALAFEPQNPKKEPDESNHGRDVDPETELADAALDGDPAPVLDALAHVQVLAIQMIQEIKRVLGLGAGTRRWIET